MKLNSTAIQELKYSDSREDLKVVYTTSPDVVYTYHNVPKSVVEEIKNAKSVGAYVAKEIAKKYSFTTSKK